MVVVETIPLIRTLRLPNRSITLMHLLPQQSFFRINHATPIKLVPLTQMLQNYTNKDYILDGFRYGFPLGFEGPDCDTYGQNRATITDNLDIAHEKISQEIALNRIAGPFVSPPFVNFKISL